MSNDPATLTVYIRIGLWVAALCATAFPLLYLFSPWRGSKIGRVVMLQGVAFSLAIDRALLFQYWAPSDSMARFWINAFVVSLIAVSAASLTGVLWVSNYKQRKSHKETIENEYSDSASSGDYEQAPAD